MAEKKPVAKGKSMQVWKLYEGTKRKNKSCPKCGPGVFLAEHQNRISCGKCAYTEMKKANNA
ncbi:MAG: 30S ribosomal protein S27ae [Candidatus Woesearchaeota archaeon]